MNKIKLENRVKLSIKRALIGGITGQDIKAIVEYQVREYINEGDEPFNDVELALMASYMMTYN